MPLSDKELKRYSRQIILSNIEASGQQKLHDSVVGVVGLGALGSVIANNLARAGVGKLILADRDVVELDNLHRQILYDEGMLGEPKAIAAAEYLNRVNPDVEVKPVVKDVNFSTIGTIVSKSELILDGTDNMETRFLINDYSVKKGIPWIYGGVVGTQGMTMNIIPNKKSSSPCFRCVIPELPTSGSLPTCDTFGILNTVPNIIGSIQSTEAIKMLLGSTDVNQKLLFYDVWAFEFRALEISQNDSCKCCVEHDYEYLNVKKRTIVTTLCGQDSVQITPIKSGALSLSDFSKKLSRVGRIKKGKHTLEFKLQDYKITIFTDGRVLIKGTTDENLAKSIYAKYIGT